MALPAWMSQTTGKNKERKLAQETLFNLAQNRAKVIQVGSCKRSCLRFAPKKKEPIERPLGTMSLNALLMLLRMSNHLLNKNPMTPGHFVVVKQCLSME